MESRLLIKKFLTVTFFVFFTIISTAKTLKYSDHEPLGGMRTKFIKEVFFSAIEKESKGRLKIEAHWGSEVSNGYDALRIVGKEGLADMAIVVPEYATNDLPLHQMFKSFPVGPTGDKQVKFFQRIYKEIPAFPEELKKENVVNIFFATGYPAGFFATKPINSLDDLKGGVWRSASFWHQGFLKNAGATPITMPWGELVYKAIEDKTLDGLIVNIDSAYLLKAHEIAPNALVSKDLWLGHVYLLVMNKDTWDGLSKEDQKAIQRAANTAYKTLGPVMDKSFDTMIDDFKKENVSVRILEPKEVKQWESITKYQDAQAIWVKEQEAKGIKDVASIMEKVTSILNDSIE